MDLIIQRPGATELLVEIKSARRVTGEYLSALKRFQKDWDLPCEAQVWSLDETEKVIDGVRCLDWKTALQRYFVIAGSTG